MSNPPPGFKMPEPTAPPAQAGYPAPPNPGYPPQQAYYPPPAANYPPPPAYSGHQPFPGPIQQQIGGPAMPLSNWYGNTDFAAYLRGAASFHVKQKKEILEIITGWETANRYEVKDQLGNKVFYVGEESDFCNLQCCGSNRKFSLLVKDLRGCDVLRFERPLNCSCCCGFFCPDQITVSTATGQLLGTVQANFSCIYPRFSIKDAHGKTQLRIEGPLCPFSWLGSPVAFKVLNLSNMSVGTISKEWGGFVQELFTDADFFSMSFPPDMDPSIKAVCLAALFLIDYEYFEDSHKRSSLMSRIF